MTLSYKHLLPDNFTQESRVWIYQCNRLFSLPEVLEVEDMLEEFVSQWQSHGVPVKGFATVFFGRFILLMADESASGVSGCSTDSSVRLIQGIEKKFTVNLFDRQLLAFVVKDNIELLPISQLPYAVTNGYITAQTLYFNNTVSSKSALLSDWIIPAGQSWLSLKFSGFPKENSSQRR